MRRIAASVAFPSCFAVGLVVIVGCGDDGGGGGVPPASYSVAENAGSATITATRTGGSGGGATVDYATSDGTAVDGSDYTAASGTLTWADGVAGPKTFTITIINDATVEGDETVDLTLSNVTGASLGAPSTGVLTILDEDAPGTLQFSGPAYSVDEAAGPATITVTRIGGATGAVAVDYDTVSGGSATEGTDYTAATGTLNWADGNTAAKTFTVAITNDTDVESDETVMLELSNATGGASLGPQSTAVLTIVDNDGPGTLQFSMPQYFAIEGIFDGNITVTRTGGSGGAVSVNYATSNGTAVAPGDYTDTPGTLNWADGVSGTKSFTVPITNDANAEGDETVNLTLSGATGATLGAQRTAVLVIWDDDAPSTLQFSAAAYSVDEDGVTATITVVRGGNPVGAASVDYAISDGTAVAPGDYTATPGTLNWTNLDMADKTFTIAITDDAIIEGNETVNLTLTNPTGGATLGAQRTAVLTIVDEDAPGTIQFAP